MNGCCFSCITYSSAPVVCFVVSLFSDGLAKFVALSNLVRLHFTTFIFIELKRFGLLCYILGFIFVLFVFSLLFCFCFCFCFCLFRISLFQMYFCCWRMYVVPVVPSTRAWHCVVECITMHYLCVVACDHRRADLSRVKNQYGHWVCWMSTSRRTV